MSQKAGSASERGDRGGRGRSRDLGLPAELQALFDQAVKDAAGKPLSMEPDSPLGRMIGAFVEHCLTEEMNEHLGYQAHHRIDPEAGDGSRRANTRNGYSSKRLKTSMGSAQIEIPRDRAGEFEPRILPKHQSMSDEIAHRVLAMYAHGMTTRDIAGHVRELYHIDASENFVSRLAERLDPELNQWRNRPLESIYAIVYVDALHLKVRHVNGVASTAAYIVSGYGESGQHEIMGIWIAPSEHSPGHGESASFWHQVFIELQKRGIKTILIACSDGLKGIEDALSASFPDTVHLSCVVHMVRASLRRVPYDKRKKVASLLKKIYQAPSYQAAGEALEAFESEYGCYPAIIKQWREALGKLAPLWTYSQTLRRIVYTTNPLENINRQIRKVIKNRSVMPGIDSALRLLTMVLRDIDGKRTETNRVRPDWINVVRELHIHFPDALPEQWGYV